MRALACVLLIACGSDDVEGEPLIGSTLMAEFNSMPYEPKYGFARMEDSRFAIYLGREKISCADDFMGTPRNGFYAALGISGEPAIGTLPTTLQMIQVIDRERFSQLVTGTINISNVTGFDVDATLAFQYVTAMEPRRFLMSGAVSVARCQ